MSTPKKIRLNQTFIKKLKEDSICPSQIYHVFIEETAKMEITDSQNKGRFFEELCLLQPGETPIVQAPKLKNGSMPIDYVRISEQAEFFREEVTQQFGLDIKPMNRQIYMEYDYAPNVVLHGKIDFNSPIKDEILGDVPMAIHDLKMTGSIFKQFGDYSWAFPYNIDHTQAFMYTFLYKELFGWTLPFYYWVFDYSPDKNYKVFRKQVEPLHLLELQESIRMSVEKIKLFERNGWNVTVPMEKNCKNCPLKENCKSYNPKKSIEVI